MTKIAITWRKSAIGYNQRQKDTIRKLGLRRLNQTVEHDDSPALRGMIAKVGHLIDVQDGQAGEA
ncbi:MAG TPA: 50S ribosomal protein L30 [Dehalococcoidia bacterium]|nr:50S ribosomal protein L30 [Dehalococcoidia bacterium]|tara:strand:+ start:767 stop:961 length:195 start_codon:yes stop_codon:yes gene_type:complete